MSRGSERVGRDYQIDYLGALCMLPENSDVALIEGFTVEDRQKGKDANVAGFTDFWDQKGTSWASSIDFNRISYLQRTSDPRQTIKRFGILFLRQMTTKYDFVSSSGETLIPRGVEVVEMAIPQVRFPQNKKEVVTPRMLTRSFGIAAGYLSSGNWSADIGFVIGLTHPRMGNLAGKRWGFSVETRPFPAEVYQLIDLGLKNEEIDPIGDPQSLELLSRQVLVYQTREEFVKRALSLKDLGVSPKDEVLELARITERRSLQWYHRWHHTGASVRLSAAIDPSCSDEQVLKDPGVLAVVKQEYQKGEVGVDGTIVPFKTKPERISTAYKYSPGVRVIPVSEVPQGGQGEARYAIIIPSPNPNVLPIIKFLSPKDRVVDFQNGHQIYP